MTDQQETALIVGAGSGLSASLARLCAQDGMAVHLAARDPDKLTGLCDETGATAHRCDATDPAAVAAVFDALPRIPDLVVFNPSKRVRGGVHELDPAEVKEAIEITCFGGFVVGREAARRMLPRGSGSILFTGASASVKGYANSSTFAMGKFGLRGLCQSMARELQPKGIHVGHFVIDGAIASDSRSSDDDRFLSPDAIARSYLNLHRQHRSAWTWEVELRPWVETF
ncbi:MAG: SDR family NAD(P)-dependent oxidoreductase [Alphaproteobacteria bacterium]|nr:SDR family NAD(P)-dependent oxidoreductase [Alphaproteobacteria bacterium]